LLRRVMAVDLPAHIICAVKHYTQTLQILPFASCRFYSNVKRVPEPGPALVKLVISSGLFASFSGASDKKVAEPLGSRWLFGVYTKVLRSLAPVK
jgi:hypothetical protein